MSFGNVCSYFVRDESQVLILRTLRSSAATGQNCGFYLFKPYVAALGDAVSALGSAKDHVFF